MYQGIYHEKKQHEEDLDDVVARAKEVGCVKMMVTASDLEEAGKVLDVCVRFRGYIHIYTAYVEGIF